MEFLGYFAAIFMGLTLGLIGGGGSILTVPLLVYLFSVEPLLATSYSLFIVGCSSFIGGLLYLKNNHVDFKTGFLFALPSFAGVYLSRHLLLPIIPDPVFDLANTSVNKGLLLMTLFAILMILSSVSMIRAQDSEDTSKKPQKNFFSIGFKGFLVGAVTGFVGAGGGFLIIPALVMLVGLPMKIAVGTSLFIIAANTLLGFAGDLSHQSSSAFNWSLMLTIAGIAVVGLLIGTRLANKVSEIALKRGFGFFVLLMGLAVLLDQLTKLS